MAHFLAREWYDRLPSQQQQEANQLKTQRKKSKYWQFLIKCGAALLVIE